MRFFIHTMGCKLNRFDSAEAAGILVSTGAKASKLEEADLIVLNTCAVTHKADREARRLVRSFRKRNPGALLLVTGCSARLFREDYAGMTEVDGVIASNKSLESFLESRAGTRCSRAPFIPLHFENSTRAFLKIQEGCNFPCSYCIIPTVRGKSRSVEMGDVARSFRALVEAGFKEIVLTGVNTGEYGKDLGFAHGLERLIERLLIIEGTFRIRLNSVEPRAVTPGLVTLLRSEESLAAHLQLPLQSGSDDVLKAMKRNYSPDLYEEVVNRLYEEVPGIGIGADVMTGFPTERTEDFDRTFALIEGAPLAFLHVFSYSPRPGTIAAALPPLPPSEVSERTRLLRELGALKNNTFAGSQRGKELKALTLGAGAKTKRALTGNYLDVELTQALVPNAFVQVEINSAVDGKIFARPLAPSSTLSSPQQTP